MGILPCITAVFSIIGLICWSTYRNWFNAIIISIMKKQKSKEKAPAQKTKTKQTHIKAENSETNYIPWIIAVTILCLATIGSGIGFYFLGKAQGYDNGYSEGHIAGSSTGYRNGYSSGETSGYSRGYNNGYDKGYQDMWNKAMCIINGRNSSCN